jgi:hypothetical protein
MELNVCALIERGDLTEADFHLINVGIVIERAGELNHENRLRDFTRDCISLGFGACPADLRCQLWQ